MGSGYLAADLTLGNLAPASAVRAVDGQWARQETGGRAPRRRRMENENENSDEPILTSDDHAPSHQLDHLA
jgi:hypothetical protein